MVQNKSARLIVILFFVLIVQAFFITGCGSKERVWKFYKEITTGDAKPNGVVYLNGNLWISDTPNNRILEIDTSGNIIKEFGGFKRPMHISLFQNKIFIPEFLNDSIKIIDVKTGKVSSIAAGIKPDAPAGIAVNENYTCIADFYNHRVLLKSNEKTTSIGKKGHGKGELFYPTDVFLNDDLIYIADAYNNRIQVFDKNGKFQKVIGSNDNIKTATGIFVNNKNIFITDFENNRILIYSKQGKLLQNISDPRLDNPSDIYIYKEMLYVSNYGGNSIVFYRFL